MKKLLLSAVAVLMFAVAANAQEQGQFRASLDLVVGTKAAVDDDGESTVGLGLNLGAEYFFTDNISVSPSYTYFFPSSVEVQSFDFLGNPTTEEIDYKPSVFNLDGRYYFGGDLQFYALAGLAFQSLKVETSVVDFDGSTTTFNIGGGVELPLSDALNFNGQVKFMGGDDTETFDGGQVVLNAGISYSFN